jgi:hypothetical protein
MYTPVGSNWTLTFQATWSYGDKSGQPISNATVTIQVSGSKSGSIIALNQNTTSGLFWFNYSSSTPEIITFTPTKLTTQDGVEWNQTLLKTDGNQVYGFQSKSVTVWYDTFNVLLVNSNTATLENTAVSLNVTYLLLPEEGLTLPSENTYSNQTFLSKLVHRANVTINGIEAKETSGAGTYTADVSTVFPTAYIMVAVSQEGWVTTNTGFSFTHNANEPLWRDGVLIIGVVIIVISLTFLFASFRKAKDKVWSRKRGYAFLGGVLLAIASVISLYWGMVALDSTLHGFNWILLTIIGFLTFGSGLVASVFALRRKNQALVLFIVILPIITNFIGVKYSLDMYQLTNSWLMLIVSLAFPIISAVLISNADEVFAQ